MKPDENLLAKLRNYVPAKKFAENNAKNKAERSEKENTREKNKAEDAEKAELDLKREIRSYKRKFQDETVKV